MLPNGLPWSIPLLLIVTSDALKYAALQEMCLDDRLISPMFVDKCKARYGKLPIRTSSTLLYSLGQLFHLDFGSEYVHYGLRPTGAQVARLWYVMTSVSTNRYHRTPYTGTSIHAYDVKLLMAEY